MWSQYDLWRTDVDSFDPDLDEPAVDPEWQSLVEVIDLEDEIDQMTKEVA